MAVHPDPDRAVEGLVLAARLIARRLNDGGRLVARGSGRSLSDARHVAVEFLHPVIVGKPALPALLASEVGPGTGAHNTTDGDVVIGIAYGGELLDGAVHIAISDRPIPGAEVWIELPGSGAAAKHAAVVSYHVLWEMTHVFLERSSGATTGNAAIGALYPMLYGADEADTVDSEARGSVAGKLAEAEAVRARALEHNDRVLDRAAEIVAAARSVYTFGNGGSATDAEDLAFAIGPRGVALSSDMATVTALANDVGFDVVFARPLATLARAGDVAVGLSTSGGSANVLAGLAFAKGRGLPTIGLAGYGGGEMKAADLDVMLAVDSDSVHRIQEAQVALYSEVLARAGTP